MAESRFTERRKQRRVEEHLAITLHYLDEEVKTFTKNISILGTFVEIERKIPEGNEIKIKLEIPAYLPEIPPCAIHGLGIVYRLEKKEGSPLYGLGIFFRNFAAHDEEKINAYVNYLLLKQEEKFLKRQLHREKPE